MVRLHPTDLGASLDGAAGTVERSGTSSLFTARTPADPGIRRAGAAGRSPRGLEQSELVQDQGARVVRAGLNLVGRFGYCGCRLDPGGEVVAVSTADLGDATVRGLHLRPLDLLACRGRGADRAHGRRVLPRRDGRVPRAAQSIPGLRGRTEHGRHAAMGDLP